MQYYSAFNGCPNGETNFPYIPFPPVCAPQVVGEGDVTAVTLPDGTLQLYFVPAARAYLGGCLPWGAVPAWFIRTIPNLFPAHRPFSTSHRDNASSSHTYLYPNNAEESEEKLKYQLHFHNDKTTSSTDMHYFSQPPHVCMCYSKQSVETQVEPSLKYYEVCCKACRCRLCQREVKARASNMSVDSNTGEDKRTQKVSFGSDTSCDKFCDNCNHKRNGTKCTSDKSN